MSRNERPMADLKTSRLMGLRTLLDVVLNLGTRDVTSTTETGVLRIAAADARVMNRIRKMMVRNFMVKSGINQSDIYNCTADKIYSKAPGLNIFRKISREYT